MAKKPPANHRASWTQPQVQQLQKLAKGNTPTRIIALKMERTESAIRGAAAENDISLKPTNQSPYGSKK